MMRRASSARRHARTSSSMRLRSALAPAYMPWSTEGKAAPSCAAAAVPGRAATSTRFGAGAAHASKGSDELVDVMTA